MEISITCQENISNLFTENLLSPDQTQILIDYVIDIFVFVVDIFWAVEKWDCLVLLFDFFRR